MNELNQLNHKRRTIKKDSLSYKGRSIALNTIHGVVIVTAESDEELVSISKAIMPLGFEVKEGLLKDVIIVSGSREIKD